MAKAQDKHAAQDKAPDTKHELLLACAHALKTEHRHIGALLDKLEQENKPHDEE